MNYLQQYIVRFLKKMLSHPFQKLDYEKGVITMKSHPKKKQATPGVSKKGGKMPPKAPRESAAGGTSRTAGPQKAL